MSLAELEKCKRCNVRWEDHDEDRFACSGFVGASDVRAVAKENANAAESNLRSGKERRHPSDRRLLMQRLGAPSKRQGERRGLQDRRAILSEPEKQMLLKKPLRRDDRFEHEPVAPSTEKVAQEIMQDIRHHKMKPDLLDEGWLLRSTQDRLFFVIEAAKARGKWEQRQDEINGVTYVEAK